MGTPLPSPQDAISEDGFFKADDAELGERTQQMDEDAVVLGSERGLHFYSTNVLQYPQIRFIIESTFEQPCLGIYRTFGAAPGVFSFDKKPQSNLEILIVMFWTKGSRVSFWPTSHRHDLEQCTASNSLLEVPNARLHQLNLEARLQFLEHGGFTIHDARVAFQIHEGIALTFIFGAKETVAQWHPMRILRSLEGVVQGIDKTTIGMNVLCDL
ncbi:hypothetical protein F5883DRAFT_422601 [Diaporthe sp. PMI_573]|nr:hypothetical protein F5883DRAFT_422601 [Diaporthaceae sp. PMI_573]